MEISYDEKKRAWTIEHRGLDFEDAPLVFDGPTIAAEDDREDYGERRIQTFGILRERLVTLVWTEREGARHIISMRKCNDRERRKYEKRLGGP